MLKEESVGDRTRCLNLFPPPWAQIQSVGWAQEHNGTLYKGRRAQCTRTQGCNAEEHKGTMYKSTRVQEHKGAMHKITRAQGCTIANYPTHYLLVGKAHKQTNYCKLFIK